MESIKSIFAKVSGDPIILIISLVILGVVVYTVTKKLFKIAILVILFIGIYLGYVAITEGSGGVEKVIDNSIEAGKDIGNEIFESKTFDEINID